MVTPKSLLSAKNTTMLMQSFYVEIYPLAALMQPKEFVQSFYYQKSQCHRDYRTEMSHFGMLD
jgi:hypothetical protein